MKYNGNLDILNNTLSNVKLNPTMGVPALAQEGEVAYDYINDVIYGRNNVGLIKFNRYNYASSSGFPLMVSGYANYFSCVIDPATNDLWTWGYNFRGQLADGTATNRSSPGTILGGHKFVFIVAAYGKAFALKSDGSCWGWGYNVNGNLGDGTATDASSPVSVLGGKSFTRVAGGYNNGGCALTSDGVCWTWGTASGGELGDGTTTPKSSPVSVLGPHSFIAVSSGNQHIAALKANGEVWTWGTNTGGKLGNGNTTARSSPGSIVGGHSFIKIACGAEYAGGIRGSDGYVLCWGQNTNYQVGDGTVNSRSTPVSVLGNKSFVQLALGASHSLALQVDGSCWSWGLNTNGQIGDNTITTRSSPSSVVGGHSFVQIAAGNSFSIALKSDGSVWGWGYNSSGNIGDGTITHRSSPVSVVKIFS